MDRFDRYGFYLKAWGRGHAPGNAVGPGAAAGSIGIHHHMIQKPLMSIDDFDSMFAPVEGDDCDVGPSARDERIIAEAHARLSKLILAGGHVETGGRSLYEAADDEIVRLRAALSDETEAAGSLAARVVDTSAELQQAKEALTQARAKVEELAMTIGDTRAFLMARPDDPTPVAARRAINEAREHGAAEMRELALRVVTEEGAAYTSGLRVVADRIRALPLSGAPAPHVDIDAAERRRSETFRALDGAGVPFGEAMAAAGDDAREQGGLSAEDAETLRGAGWLDRDGAWYAPAYDLAVPGGIESLRWSAHIIRAQRKPAPARGTPGKATGAEAAGTGKDSVAEEPARAQGGDGETQLERAAALLRQARWYSTARHLEDGNLPPKSALAKLRAHNEGKVPDADDAAAMAALEALIAEPAAPSAHAGLPKPKRVEVGQRWKHTNDPHAWTVGEIDRHNDDMLVTLRTDSRRVVRVCESWLTEAPFWIFLGSAPQDTPKRDGEEEEPQCGGPREACALPGCSECGAPADAQTLHDEKRRVRLTCPKDADARSVAAACVELLGLSSDEVHGGNVVEAFEAGVAEGERRAKAKAAEPAPAVDWTMGPDGQPSERFQRLALEAGKVIVIETEGEGMVPRVLAEKVLRHLAHVHGLAPRDAAPAPVSPPGAPDRETLGRAVHEAWQHAWRSNLTWDDTTYGDHNADRLIGERLFNMGVQWARQNAAAPAEPEAQYERWRPGAVWEHKSTAGNAARFELVSVLHGRARFFGWLSFAVSAMTEANGWRYVGPAKAG